MKDLQDTSTDEVPAPFKSWRAWYTLVIATLAVVIITFYIISRIFL